MATGPSCDFCIKDMARGTAGVEPERIIKQYEHWWLVLARLDKRRKTVQAAGLLVARRHVSAISQASVAEFGELPAILHDASASLCSAVGAEYTRQMRFGCNEGDEAGQTMPHAHIHILPVSKSDPAVLKVRGGIGGAFEALREARLGVSETTIIGV